MKIKSKFMVLAIGLVTILALTACGKSNNGNANNGNANNGGDDTTPKAGVTGEIVVVSREDGSGTRGAFTEITKILEKDANGNEVDGTYSEALIQNSTDAVMQTVSNDETAIGYISLGSLNDKVKAVKINDVAPDAEEIVNGNYPIARPFILVNKAELSDLGKDFINFIVSEEGQKISEGEGYIKVKDIKPYEKNEQNGKIVVAGSTSVTPVLEKLAEAYEAMYSEVVIEIQSTGSSAGIQATVDGAADIGMSSRELKDKEKGSLEETVIAIDGIAVIVNNDNGIESITLDNVKNIFTGKITEWEEVQ